MKKVLRLLQFVIPVILLAIVFSKIDFSKVAEVYVQSNKVLLFLAFVSFPLSYALFSLRWKLVLNMFGKRNISYLRLLKIVYIGFFSGYFLPASVGIDIYRVYSLRKTDTTPVTIGLLFQEKLMGLLICGFFILFFSGILSINDQLVYPHIRTILYVFLSILILVIALMLLFKNSRVVQLVLAFIERKLFDLIKWFALKFNKEVKVESGFLNKILQVSLYPKLILLVAAFSLINQFIGAVFSNIAFNALGAEIPLSYNLFANPLLNILFLFPISFGGFGIREGSYILIFGLLGVSSEISLLVSFVFLISTFINVGIGGILFMFNKKVS
ncbi:lysylphosphatidylglycerol synthase transmembrane domain-containing protein [uncultured Draconibacterium sp.]|uniref:lysylphosphatidylglycerol synthase transmembrane domain-containing protein n=1 Tax=uncultured Draconibacterium sp. TaxID=1573823 RepID=UPI0025F93560|nr:lysylphosphatidylglycerol synthase transmembrane domain-containing protein [uncultured Draconibacterium sp.]